MAVVLGTVINQTSIDLGFNELSLVVSINHYLDSQVTLGGVNETGIVDPWPRTEGGNEATANQTITCFVNAQLVAAGSLLTVEGAGGLPLSYNNILLTENATIIDADLFA